MKRSLVIFLGVLLSVLAPAAAGASGRTVKPARAQLRHPICQAALEPVGRAISVRAVMRPVTGTAKMQLRFDLLSRAKGSASYRPVSGGDLGSWIAPQDPTLGRRAGDVWILDKQVVDLAAPALYRFRVSFRWIGPHHRVIASATKFGSRCAQSELRPDLLVRRVTVLKAAKPTRSIYVVSVVNAGATAAGPFSVQFAPGGSATALSRSVPGLGAHSGAMLRINAPACVSGVTPTITVDPGQQVEDFNRTNNVFTVSCPAP